MVAANVQQPHTLELAPCSVLALQLKLENYAAQLMLRASALAHVANCADLQVAIVSPTGSL